MLHIPLALGIQWVLVAAALALVLLLVVQYRALMRIRTLDLEVQRLTKAQKAGALDARTRLEEATRSLDDLQETVAPRIAEVGSRLEEMEAQMGAVTPLLEAAQAGGSPERFGEVEDALRETRGRVVEVESELGRMRSDLGERLDDLHDRVRTAAAPPPRPSRPAAVDAAGDESADEDTTPAPVARSGSRVAHLLLLALGLGAVALLLYGLGVLS